MVEQPERKEQSNKDRWVQWISGLCFLLLIAGVVGFELFFSRSDNAPQSMPGADSMQGPHDQIRDMPVEDLLALNRPHGDDAQNLQEASLPHPAGEVVAEVAATQIARPALPEASPGRQPVAEPNADTPEAKVTSHPSGLTRQAAQEPRRGDIDPRMEDLRRGGEPGRPDIDPRMEDWSQRLEPGVDDPRWEMSELELRLEEPRDGIDGRGRREMEEPGWLDRLFGVFDAPPPEAPPPNEEAGPREWQPPPATGEGFGSAIMIVSTSEVGDDRLPAEVYLHLLLASRRAGRPELSDSQLEALHDVLTNLQRGLAAVSNIELALTELLTDAQREVVLAVQFEPPSEPVSRALLETRLEQFSRALEAAGTSPLEVKVDDSSFEQRPWRFGFPILVLTEGGSKLLERGMLDPEQRARCAALIRRFREAFDTVFVELEGIGPAMGDQALTPESIGLDPSTEMDRFSGAHLWEPALMAMVNLSVSLTE